MTERTKTIKGLISGQVDMGTFGLVELELLAIENEMEALRKQAVISSVCECKVCGKPFGDKLSLYEHYDEEHNKQTDL